MIGFLLIIVILANLHDVNCLVLHESLAAVPKPAAANNPYKLVAYYPSWSETVKKPWTYGANHIDPKLFTHMIYSHAVLDNKSLEIIPKNPKDVITGYKSITDLKIKNPNLKVLLSLECLTDRADKSEKYARLVKSPISRHNFIAKAILYLLKHKFDGLNIDLRYPIAKDKSKWATFIKELKEGLQVKHLQLFVTISPKSETIDSAYDVPNISKYSDFIIVFTIGLHNSTEGSQTTKLIYPKDAIESAIKHLLWKGADSKKLIVTISFHGTTYTLKNANHNGLGDPVKGAGIAGPFTQTEGYLAYYEICQGKDWTKKRVNTTKGVYAFKGNQWVSYDDPTTVESKSKYVKINKLAGVCFEPVSGDDFLGICCNVKNILVKAVHNALLGKENFISTTCP